MNQKIKKYLDDDTIFNEINKQFISLEHKSIKKINEHLNEVFFTKIFVLLKNLVCIFVQSLCMLQALRNLIEIMKNQNPLFKETFKKTVWTGSFYKKTKIGLPDEFDLNLIIKLPIKEDNIQVIAVHF